MFTEDNNGYVFFPHPNNRIIIPKNTGKTLIYLISFEPNIINDDVSNIYFDMPGVFISEDVTNRPDIDVYNSNINSLINNQKMSEDYDKRYFPNINSQEELLKLKSIKLLSCICIGWNKSTYIYSNENRFWSVTFKDLTTEGRRLYYSIKKLHNNKEVRILTFNNVDN